MYKASSIYMVIVHTNPQVRLIILLQYDPEEHDLNVQYRLIIIKKSLFNTSFVDFFTILPISYIHRTVICICIKLRQVHQNSVLNERTCANNQVKKSSPYIVYGLVSKLLIKKISIYGREDDFKLPIIRQLYSVCISIPLPGFNNSPPTDQIVQNMLDFIIFHKMIT